jgi:hypothetical protein
MNHSALPSLIALAALGCLRMSSADAVGVDICYNNPDAGVPLVSNCIEVDLQCRTSNLIPPEQLACRVAATAQSVSGLSGSNTIIGGRSLLHSDSTYLMAQLMGYTPWQAYQVMIYDEATDQSDYYPFDQSGRAMVSDEQITSCRAQWGTATMLRSCWTLTPVVNGLYKFNSTTGGMLLHLHARYSPNGAPPPTLAFPTDYFSRANAPYEPLVNNLRAWAFGRRPDACVSGIVARNQSNERAAPPCEVQERVINSPQNLFAAGVTLLAVPFVSELGTLTINDDDRGTALASDRSFQTYIAPHQVGFAKFGVFLHALGDRISHHECTDRSWFQRSSTGDYDSTYDSVYCAQGSHFLWHVWEQGTDQDPSNLEGEYRTLQPTLETVYDQLLEYARLRGIPARQNLDKQAIVNRLVGVLGISDAQTRLDAMVALMQEYQALPLPGHGSAANLSLDQWLTAAGAPAR